MALKMLVKTKVVFMSISDDHNATVCSFT